MGNKSTSPSRDPDIEKTQREEANNTETASGSGPRGPPCPSPDLLASLQSLGEHSDHTLLPQSLHQIAEAYSLEEEYHWAVQFLQLERLYHERLLSNLAALQEVWESQWRERNRAAESTSPGETNSIGQEHIEMLSQICRTHQRPMLSAEKSMADTVLKDNHNTRGQCERNESETSPSHHGKVRGNNPVKQGEEDLEQTTSTGADPAMDEEKGGVEEGEGGVEEMEEEGQGVFEESPEEEVQVVEWPAGVPQASAKDLVKLSHVEESSSTGGLVSILKRRGASLDGLPPEGPDSAKQNSKRKVRFSEPEDGMEPDEVGGDSCLILLLLCLVTVVISLGGTALYCTLVDTYSSICTDFSHNIDFYVVQVRRFLDGLRHWWLERML
ncbi:consortin, connexin sorting protein b [Coregonus clupeaformis]|uniref:consortin, connexin sorting protein b n=1 Tax=Coregonus clupeaformis TaxID=59861 RepID=UPI001E1C7CA6|nr:consortin, connexin sorting protein b [Coregonus clupeaformis]XP_041720667.2 consortin, connexin sorting protein b [Coregonus clupeaformis]